MAFPPLKIRVMGSGTSTGVPVLGCRCDICTSTDLKDKRTRASVLVTRMDTEQSLVIDTGPDFRAQMIAANAAHTEAVVYTHTHADHLHGFDDLRTLYFHHKKSIDVHIHQDDVPDLKSRFSYAFQDTGYMGMPPQVEVHPFADQPFKVLGLDIDTVRLPHGSVQSSAFRLGRFAYATDFKHFPKAALEQWRGKVDTFVVSGLRFRPHRTHSCMQESIALAQDLGAKVVYLSHISHEVSHQNDADKLPKGFHFAYDGLEFQV